MPTIRQKASHIVAKASRQGNCTDGGMEGQLRKLRNGIHPKTGAVLPPPIELDPVSRPVKANASEEERKLPDGFYFYEPSVIQTATPNDDAGWTGHRVLNLATS